MIPVKNLPQLLDLVYFEYNRAIVQPDGSRGDFQPVFNSDGNLETSFCNLFIHSICNSLGYSDFYKMEADGMFNFMNDPSHGWISVSDSVAQQHANNGVIVIAAHASAHPGDDAHGHVCLIIPGILEFSAGYGKMVPKCANVGKDVFFGKKISWAFPSTEQPTYFALSQMI